MVNYSTWSDGVPMVQQILKQSILSDVSLDRLFFFFSFFFAFHYVIGIVGSRL